MEKKISTSEIVGHLRQANRLFKAFEKASEAAELIHGFEKKVSDLEKDVDALTTEKESLNIACEDIACEEVVKSIDLAKKEEKSLKAKSKERNDAVNLHIDKMMGEAKVKAEKLVASATTEANTIMENIKTLKSDETVSMNAKIEAEKELDKVLKKIKSTKERFINSL